MQRSGSWSAESKKTRSAESKKTRTGEAKGSGFLKKGGNFVGFKEEDEGNMGKKKTISHDFYFGTRHDTVDNWIKEEEEERSSSQV